MQGILCPAFFFKDYILLITNKIILGFRTMIDPTKLGYEANFLFLKTNIKNKETNQQLQDFLQKNKQITYATKLIGEYNYVITVLTKNNFELNEFIKSIKQKFSGTIIGIESAPLFEMPYHTQLAKEFLE